MVCGMTEKAHLRRTLYLPEDMGPCAEFTRPVARKEMGQEHSLPVGDRDDARPLAGPKICPGCKQATEDTAEGRRCRRCGLRWEPLVVAPAPPTPTAAEKAEARRRARARHWMRDDEGARMVACNPTITERFTTQKACVTCRECLAVIHQLRSQAEENIPRVQPRCDICQHHSTMSADKVWCHVRGHSCSPDFKCCAFVV